MTSLAKSLDLYLKLDMEKKSGTPIDEGSFESLWINLAQVYPEWCLSSDFAKKWLGDLDSESLDRFKDAPTEVLDFTKNLYVNGGRFLVHIAHNGEFFYFNYKKSPVVNGMLKNSEFAIFVYNDGRVVMCKDKSTSSALSHGLSYNLLTQEFFAEPVPEGSDVGRSELGPDDLRDLYLKMLEAVEVLSGKSGFFSSESEFVRGCDIEKFGVC